MSDLVVASIVTGGFGVIVAMIGYLAHTNKREHAENGGKLDQLLRGHDRIEGKIDTPKLPHESEPADDASEPS